jgi:hypothetical protein
LSAVSKPRLWISAKPRLEQNKNIPYGVRIGTEAEMPDWPVLAERKLLVEEDGGEGRREIALQIGHPYWVKDGIEAACPVALHGFSENMQAMRGIDFVQALQLALGFLDMITKSGGGIRFFWPDGETYEPISLPKDSTADER